MNAKKNILQQAKERLRRTRLYIPGNNPAMIQNAVIYGADSLIFDLEDSITISEKDSARMLVRNAIKNLDFGNCEITVRINAPDTPFFKHDLEMIVPVCPDGLVVPKIESAKEIEKINKLITEIEKEQSQHEQSIALMPIIESALGVVNIEEIAAAPRVVAIGLGGEDLTADIGAKRTKSGQELDYISSKLIIACAVNKIQAIDTVYA
jgi:citrate lyase subunit beta/citryl-CoA lyase